MTDDTPLGPDGSPAMTKTCPSCAEQVQSAARVCRYCAYDFELGIRPTGAPGETNGKAIASLVLAILWMFGLGSLLAVILGHMATREIDGSGGRQGGRGIAVGGLILGWLGLASVAAFILLLGGLFAAGDAVIDEFSDDVQADMASTLKNAATAQESFRTINTRYTRNPGDLRGEGFAPGGANLVIVEATKNSYCMEARAVGHVMSYDSSEGTPRDGPC
ncbi:MAG TPA: DUF4190 domain-containing protein [Actinomycetota bacterium]|nr:DUF4190 domain-containing protein [Actinomycetota bacterium]